MIDTINPFAIVRYIARFHSTYCKCDLTLAPFPFFFFLKVRLIVVINTPLIGGEGEEFLSHVHAFGNLMDCVHNVTNATHDRREGGHFIQV